jgi:hypothetical protein
MELPGEAGGTAGAKALRWEQPGLECLRGAGVGRERYSGRGAWEASRGSEGHSDPSWAPRI